MSGDEVMVERRDHILIVRLNRPEARNALNRSALQGLSRAMSDAENDADIRCVVLTGTGDGAFCAGMDLRSFAKGERINLSEDDPGGGFHRLTYGNSRVPVIGAANASAVAGGLELLLGCDIIVASSQAKFGLPEVKRGLFPGGGGTLIGTRVPLSVALEMLLTGDSIDAERAYALGLVNAVVEPERVLDAAIEFAERVACNGPLGVKAAKELARLAVTDGNRAAERLRELQPSVFHSEDAKEGARAFVEKRPPIWQGR